MTTAETDVRHYTTPPPPRLGRRLANWLSSTDHKVIGYMYLITSFAFFLAAGVMAMLMRAELAQPGMQVLGEQKGETLYNQLFTMHAPSSPASTSSRRSSACGRPA